MERVKKRGGHCAAGFITKPIPNSFVERSGLALIGVGRGRSPNRHGPVAPTHAHVETFTYVWIQDAPTRDCSVLKPLHCRGMFLATSDPKVIDELRRISAVRPVIQSIMYASIVVPFPDSPRSLTPSLPPSLIITSLGRHSEWCSLQPSSCGCSCA